MKKVLVTGVGGPAGRAVATFFRNAGCTVIGTDIIPTTTKVDDFFLVPRGNEREFTAAILAILVSERPFLIVPTVTEELVQTASLKHTIRALGVSIFTPDADSVRIANDKCLTMKELEAYGINVPRTYADEEMSSGVEAGESLGYPFVAKPRWGRGGRGVVVYFNKSGAENESRRGIVYQEFLGGDEYDVNLFANPGGQSLVTRVLLKTSLKDGIVGNALSVRPVQQADVEKLAIRAAAALKLEGPIDMDIRRSGDGVAKILEINARVGANVLAAEGVLETMMMHTNIGD